MPDTSARMIDTAAATPMMAQYLEIKRAHPDCLVLYRMGDFFELFFDDAVAAAKALDIALTKRGRLNGADIPMCGVPAHSHEAYLARLIRAGFKVAICDQIEDASDAKKRGGKALVRRAVVRIVTAGTLTEEQLLDARRAIISPASPKPAAGSASPGSICRPATSRPTSEPMRLGAALARLDLRSSCCPSGCWHGRRCSSPWPSGSRALTPLPNPPLRQRRGQPPAGEILRRCRARRVRRFQPRRMGGRARSSIMSR